MNGFTLTLRENPLLDLAMTGFDPIALLVEGRDEMNSGARRLVDLGIDHAPFRARCHPRYRSSYSRPLEI